MPDLSFLPEHIMVHEGLSDPFAWGRKQKDRIAGLIDTADLAIAPLSDTRPKIEAALKSTDALQRAWALTACAVRGEQARPLIEAAKGHLQDPDLLVRVRAAEFLGRLNAADVRPAMLEVLRQSDDSVLTLIALNTVVYLRDVLKIDLPITRADVKAQGGEVERRLEYLVGPALKKRK